MTVKEEGGRSWEMTEVYASPQHHKRSAIWHHIGSIQHIYPWMILGDFNNTLNEGGRNTPGGISYAVAKWTEEMGLVDLGFRGLIYTWKHGINLQIRHSTRLNRALCDDAWWREFPEATLGHLSYFHSDHCPYSSTD